MADDRTPRINAAVDECLDRCSKSRTPPYLTIQAHCSELRDSGWSEIDITIVDATATRIIAGIDSGHEP
jgi:hypothetical protein